MNELVASKSSSYSCPSAINQQQAALLLLIKGNELELELILSQMAQKAVLRGEVGVRV
jgi:hypothetical protein